MSEGGIEVEDDLYGFPSDRGGGELAFLLIYLFMVFFVGIGTCVITFLSWLKGLLLTHYRIGELETMNGKESRFSELYFFSQIKKLNLPHTRLCDPAEHHYSGHAVPVYCNLHEGHHNIS